MRILFVRKPHPPSKELGRIAAVFIVLFASMLTALLALMVTQTASAATETGPPEAAGFADAGDMVLSSTAPTGAVATEDFVMNTVGLADPGGISASPATTTAIDFNEITAGAYTRADDGAGTFNDATNNTAAATTPLGSSGIPAAVAALAIAIAIFVVLRWNKNIALFGLGSTAHTCGPGQLSGTHRRDETTSSSTGLYNIVIGALGYMKQMRGLLPMRRNP